MPNLQEVDKESLAHLYSYPIFRNVYPHGEEVLIHEISAEGIGRLVLLREDLEVGCRALPEGFVPFSLVPAHRVAIGLLDPTGEESGRLMVVGFDRVWEAEEGSRFGLVRLLRTTVALHGSRLVLVMREEEEWRVVVMELSDEGMPLTDSARDIFASPHDIERVRLTDDGETLVVVEVDEESEFRRVCAIDAESGEICRELEGEVGKVLAIVGFPSSKVVRLNVLANDGPALLDWSLANGVCSTASLHHPDSSAEWYISDCDGPRTLLSGWGGVKQSVGIHTQGEGVELLDLPSGLYAPWDLTSDSLILTHVDVNNPGRVIRIDLSSGEITTLRGEESRHSDDAGEMESRQVIGAEEEGIQYWYASAVGEMVCAIIDLHGGPEEVVLNQYDETVRAWTMSGAAWYSLNYHGSVLFGEEFRTSIHGRATELEQIDIAALMKVVRAEQGSGVPIILRGTSYGGLLALLGGIDHGDEIAGVIAIIPVLDWTILWEEGTEDFRDYIRLLMGGDPASRPDHYHRASPLQNIDDLRQPTLIIAAENDRRCPITSVDRYREEAEKRNLPLEVEQLTGGHASIFHDPATRMAMFEREYRFVERL